MTHSDGPNPYDPGPDPEDFAEIDREGAIWDALTEVDPPTQHTDDRRLLAGWVGPRELLILVNRIRIAQGLNPVPRLTTRYAIPGVYSSCMFARALRTWASMDTLIFRSQWHAERVAAELEVPLTAYCSIDTPHEICDVMELFDCDMLTDQDVYVPPFEQLSLSASPVEQAEEVLAGAAARTAA